MQLHLKEAQLLVARLDELLSPNGIVLYDDVLHLTPISLGANSSMGKAGRSIPFLVEHGFEVVLQEFQWILRRRRP